MSPPIAERKRGGKNSYEQETLRRKIKNDGQNERGAVLGTAGHPAGNYTGTQSDAGESCQDRAEVLRYLWHGFGKCGFSAIFRTWRHLTLWIVFGLSELALRSPILKGREVKSIFGKCSWDFGGKEFGGLARYLGTELLRIILIGVVVSSFFVDGPLCSDIFHFSQHEWLGGANLIPKEGAPHAITGETLPLTLGHEFSGVVEEVGSDVKDVKVGDRVCVQPTIWDGECRACVKGLVNCCDKNGFVGLSGWGGGMSEHIVVPDTAVKKLPENVSLELGALVEPLAVGWHAVKISPYKEGDSCLVLGGGPIGLSVVQALVGKGCKNIIVSEVSKRRSEFAKQFGAHHTLDPTKVDVVKEVLKLTGGKGADVGFDAAGVQVGLDSAMQAIRAHGTLVNIAVWEKRATLQMNDLVFRERVYMGVGKF